MIAWSGGQTYENIASNAEADFFLLLAFSNLPNEVYERQTFIYKEIVSDGRSERDDEAIWCWILREDV